MLKTTLEKSPWPLIFGSGAAYGALYTCFATADALIPITPNFLGTLLTNCCVGGCMAIALVLALMSVAYLVECLIGPPAPILNELPEAPRP